MSHDNSGSKDRDLGGLDGYVGCRRSVVGVTAVLEKHNQPQRLTECACEALFHLVQGGKLGGCQFGQKSGLTCKRAETLLAGWGDGVRKGG